MKVLKRDPYLFFLLTFSLVALTPLWAPGYFYKAHDGRHSVFYLIMFDASIRDGAFWPLWAMHHIQGYGYPTFLLQAPLGFYLAELFVLLGAGYTLAAKLAWVSGFLLGAWGMYRLVVYWLQKAADVKRNAIPLYGSDAHTMDVADDPLDVKRNVIPLYISDVRATGVVAGLLYVFIPYHLVDIYVRAALNDALLLAWFPWVFLAFDRLITLGGARGWPRRLAVAILLLAGVLLTHTFALISFAPLLVTFVLFRLVWSKTTPKLTLGGFVGRTVLAGVGGVGALLLYAAFLLPLLVEGRYLDSQVYTTNTYDYRNHFVQPGQYFSPFWGFGYSDDPAGANDGMSFQLGLIALLFGGIGFFCRWRHAYARNLALYLVGITTLLLFFMSPLAAQLWQAIPALAVIQFPWRLLALTAFTLSALGGLSLWNLLTNQLSFSENGANLALAGVLVIFGSYAYIGAPLQPVEPWREDGRAIFQFEQEHPDMIAYTEWVQQPFKESPMTAEYASPDYREDYSEHGFLTRLAIVQGVGEVVSNYSRGSSFGGVVRIARGPATVRVHLLYFPGWQVYVDGQPAFFHVSEPYGLIDVDVSAGEHHIDVRMGSTLIRNVGALISGATLLLVAGLLLWPQTRQKENS